MYTYVVNANQGGRVLQKPFGNDYQYLFGDDFLVAPIYRDQLTREVTIPDGKWRYFFNDKEVVEGPVDIKREYPLEEFPVYIREGAIIPMDIKRNYTGIGDSSSEGYLTFLIYPKGRSEFTVHHPDKSGSTSVEVEDLAEKINISVSNVHKSHILKINLSSKPEKVELDGTVLLDSLNWNFDKANNKLIIKTDNYKEGKYSIIR